MSTNCFIPKLSSGIAFTGKTFKPLLKIIRFHKALALSALLFIFLASCASQSSELSYKDSKVRGQAAAKQAAKPELAVPTANGEYKQKKLELVGQPGARAVYALAGDCRSRFDYPVPEVEMIHESTEYTENTEGY